MTVELIDIEKSFGENKVLNKVSFSAKGGGAFGLLGRNGAGKTTIIRIVMGVFPPDGGTVTVNGKRVSQSGATFGYLPEERGLYPKHPIGDQLVYIGRLRGQTRADAEKSARQWLERFSLTDTYPKKLSVLSKGNQQKVQLAAAIINDPDIVILDEPFSGFDPVNAQLLKDVVGELVGRGKVVFFSSHQMNYVEEFCEHIAIIGSGRIVLEGNLRQIKRGYDRSNVFTVLDCPGGAFLELNKSDARFSEIAQGVSEKNGGAIVRLRKPEYRDRLLALLLERNLPVERFEVLEPTLEEIFVEKVGDTPADGGKQK
ncbi:MAG: ATP-binding cassette domain-containing protein [Oscillospiraceae bacterium]|nr:ATP-binding cassette domain-containing protein [Oscillospiraceae bacterium]